MSWKLFQSSAALPGFSTEITVAMAILWGLFGRSCRLCRIFEAMKHICGRSASEYMGRNMSGF